MKALRRFIGVTPILLIGAVALSSCAYTKYMAEARGRQQDLNEQLTGEREEAKRVQGESKAREREVTRLHKEKKQLERELNKQQAKLAELNRIPPRQRTVSQQAEINKMQGEIVRLKRSIDTKKREIEQRVYE